MPFSKRNLNAPSPSSHQPSHVGQRPAPAVKESPAFNHLLHLLKKDKTISAWLDLGDRRKPELFVVLADQLSHAEREALSGVTDIVVHARGPLTKKIAELKRENQRLRSLTLTDGLTGLYNYRFFAKQLEVEIARTKRTGLPCSLMMIDLDNFKLLNDTLGHNEGNNFLVKVAQVIGEKLRPTDILCRYGGDEFAVIMPATSILDALSIAQRLKESLAGIPWKLDPPCSASIGLAECDPVFAHGISEFIETADKALYKAKTEGKNRVCFEGELEMRPVASVTQDERVALLKGDDKKPL
ncbi:MAG: GGDEF domain-containing protein [Deltaproteobacteria bacterium]|jgi:diguanylate cyclase (GGDEF)-like protein